MTAAELVEAPENPYPGLRSFRRDETHIFFGREGTVSEMVDRMAGHRFLAVTGYSGSGKSSLVRVGLLDALDRGMLVEAGSTWAVADFAPGGQPFPRLTAALVKALDLELSDTEQGLVEAKLARGPKGLLSWLDEIDLAPDTNLLLLIDQFEEIFRYRQGRIGDDVSAFVQLLLASARQRDRNIYVVITMRSDFLGDCARFTGLAEQINDGQFLTPRLTRDQCREAIEGPAGVFDGHVDSELVTRMLNDMAGNPDQLPLMQHILMLLWDEARRHAGSKQPNLTLADYSRLGGIGYIDWSADGRSEAPAKGANGALSDHADRVFEALTGSQQRLANRLFRALTESQGGGNRAVRRPMKLAQLAAITEATPADLLPIVDAFRAQGRNFLTPAAPAPIAPDTMIDITHESLIRQWGRLRQWVADEHQSAEIYRSLERGAKQWKRGRASPLSRLDLAVSRKWRTEEKPNAAWSQRYGDAFELAMAYLRKSIRYRRWRKVVSGVALAAIPTAMLVTTMLLLAFATTGVPYLNPGEEWSNFDAEPQATLKESVGTNTARAIPGGRVIGTAELERAIKRGMLGGSEFRIIDAWNRPDPKVEIPGAIFIKDAGSYGRFDDAVQSKLKEKLAEITHGKADMPLVFFCAGTSCWESYNAALRAIHLGYNRVYWYRGGVFSWRSAHSPYTIDFDLIPFDTVDFLNGGQRIVATIRQRIFPGATIDHERGDDYLQKQRFDLAIDSYTRALQRDPADARVLAQRGRAYAGKHEYGAAIVDYSAALKIEPRNVTYLGNRGYAYKDLGDNDLAIADLEAAIAIDATVAARIAPDHALVYNRRGNVHYEASNYDLAIDAYDTAIRLDPKSTIGIKNRAGAWLKKGNEKQALADYALAISVDAKDVAAYVSRAEIYRQNNDLSTAIVDLTKAIDLEPQNSGHYESRGYLRFNKGEFDGAVRDFARVGQLKDNAYAMAFRYLARARARPGGTALAELAGDRALLKDEWPRPVFDLLAGRLTPEALLKAAKDGDEMCEANFYIGQFQLLRGAKADAKTSLTIARETCKESFSEYRAAVADLARLQSGD